MALSLRNPSIAEKYIRQVERGIALIEQAIKDCGVECDDPRASSRAVNSLMLGLFVSGALYGDRRTSKVVQAFRRDFCS